MYNRLFTQHSQRSEGMMSDLFERVITAKELQEKEDFKGGNEWLIEHLVPRGQAGLTIAPQKSFKSSTTLQMALSVTKGDTFSYA